jgi:signal transduction histidine kinase
MRAGDDRSANDARADDDVLPAFELVIAELSARFINLPANAIDGAITDALRRIAAVLDVDRAQLVDFKPPHVWITHSWAVDGVPAIARNLVEDNFPWMLPRLQNGDAVALRNLDDLPAEASVDKASFHGAGTRSNLTVPMSVAGRVVGALALGCVREERPWPAAVVTRARVLADVFANALDHKRTQETLDAAMRFERLASDVLASFLAARHVDHDAVIAEALSRAADVLGAERATLWMRESRRNEFRKSHRWPDLAGRTANDTLAIPWISSQLVAGAFVQFDGHSLPAEAREDIDALHALGIRSGVIVPLAISGEVAGALSFVSTSDEREWPESLVPRIKHLGEVFAAALARNAAERREHEAKAQAIHAERVAAMGAFAASLAHELTQPLSAIESNAETAARLLAMPNPDIGELRAALQDILEDERRASRLIHKLRQYLRKGSDERRVLALHSAVDEAVRFVRSNAVDRGIGLALDVPQGLRIAGDAVQIQQVMVNLLLNAFDAATDAGGSPTVTIEACEDNGQALVEVTDSGPGMDAETLAKVFEPFFTTKASGMGLGLAISRSIVEAHGGALTAISGQGRGTTFRIALPLAERE